MKLPIQSNLSKSINRLANNNNPTDMHTGWLGNGQGVVVVPNSTNGTEVYVRVVGQSGVKIAFNSAVPNIDNLPVEIGYYPSNPIKLQIVRQMNTSAALSVSQVPTQNSHHKQHEYGGSDMVYVSKRQYMPFRLNSYGFLVVVSPDYIYTNGQWNLFYPTGATDLSGLVPGSGSRFMLVSISSNGVDTDFTTGTVSMASLTLADIPVMPSGDAPVAAVRLYTGQTGIYEYTDILDLRGNPFIGLSGSYGGGGGTGTYTVADTSTIDLTMAGNQISGVVIPTGISLDGLGSPSNNTNLNVSTSAHGLAPKGQTVESPAKYWREDWILGVPSVSGSSYGLSGWYNVEDYGAIGDGSHDDTSAIANAITAIPSTGGILYFPPGVYKTSGGFTLAYPITVMGAGMGGFNGSTAVSLINCTSATASLFTVTAYIASFKDIALQNTAVSTPSNGAGITVAGSTLVQKVNYDNISVSGFYINIDVQVGCSWAMRGCWLHAPVLYSLKIDNTQNVEAGDWAISDSGFFAEVYNSTSAIKIIGSGGGKISNVKINNGLDGKTYVNGIDVVPAGASTQTLIQVTNSSIEGFTGNGINVVTSGHNLWRLIFIGNEFGTGSGNNTGYAIAISAANLGEIEDVIIDDNIYVTDGTPRVAVSLTKVDNAFVGCATLYGFNAILVQSGCTNITTSGSSGNYTQGASVYNNSNFSVPNSGGTAIPFDTELFDTDTIHDNSTNNTRLTCKTAGKYLVTWCIQFASNSNGYRQGYIQKTSGITLTYYGVSCQNANSSAATYVNGSAIIDLAINDFVECIAQQNTSGSINAIGGGPASAGCTFSMQRIG